RSSDLTSRSTSGSWIPTRSGRFTRARLGGGLAERRRARRPAALLQVLLVVVLGRPEGLRGLDHGHDRPPPVGLLALPRGLSGRALLLVVDEDDRAVLVTDVPALAVELRRVVLAPEDVEELVVRDPLRVVRDLDHLGVA